MSQRKVDGGWPAVAGAASDAGATALALGALMEAGADLTAIYPGSRDYLLAQQLPDGSWLEDAYTTALAALVLGDAPADLAVSSFMLSAASVSQGTPITATVHVTNGGLAASTATTVALYWGDPNHGGFLLSTRPLPVVGVGQGTDVVFPIQTDQAAGIPWQGSIPLFAVVDPDAILTSAKPPGRIAMS